MIKYYNLAETNGDILSTIQTSCSGRWDGIVVSKDKRKIYYQPKDNTQSISVAQQENLIVVEDITPKSSRYSNTYGWLLLPNERYIQYTNTTTKFYVTPSSYGLRAGDTIELYLTNVSQVKIYNWSSGQSNIQPFFSSPINIGGNSTVLIKLVYEGASIWTAYIAGGGSSLAFDTSTWVALTGGWESNKNSGQPVAASALYNTINDVFTNQKTLDNQNFYFNGGVITGSTSVAPSTLPKAKAQTLSQAASTLSAGIVNVYSIMDLDVNTMALTSNWADNRILQGIDVAKAVHDTQYHTLTTMFNGPFQYTDPILPYVSTLIRTEILPQATTTTSGIVKICNGTTSATISGSDGTWIASSAYSYINTALNNLNIDAKTSSKLSAVTFNGYKYTPTGTAYGVANLGTLSAIINGKTKTATADRYGSYLNFGDTWVEITQGATETSGPNSTVGYYVQRTVDGYKLDPGIATLSATRSLTSSDRTIDAGGKAMPVMVQSPAGNFYPLQKGSLSFASNTGSYVIDIRPYMTYENISNPAGTWTIYYGAGINDLYTTANTVTSSTVNTTSYNVQFMTADVHVLTFTGTGTTTITIPDLAKGHGVIIKIINNGPRTIKFGNDTLVSSTGSYSVSFFNFGSGAERVGQVTQVY